MAERAGQNTAGIVHRHPLAELATNIPTSLKHLISLSVVLLTPRFVPVSHHVTMYQYFRVLFMRNRLYRVQMRMPR